MENIYQNVGTSKVSNIVADNLTFQKRIGVTITAAGEYAAGMLLIVDENGVARAPIASDVTVDAVLLDDIGTVKAGETAAAAASLTGDFNENAIKWGGIADSDRADVIQEAAKHLLFLSPMARAEFMQYGGEI